MAIQEKIIQARGSINSSYTMKLTVKEESTDISNNSSNVSWRLDLISTSYNFAQINSTIKVNVDGEAYNNTSQRSIRLGETLKIAEGSKNVTHSSDGTKAINISFSYNQASTLNFTPREYEC